MKLGSMAVLGRFKEVTVDMYQIFLYNMVTIVVNEAIITLYLWHYKEGVVMRMHCTCHWKYYYVYIPDGCHCYQGSYFQYVNMIL